MPKNMLEDIKPLSRKANSSPSVSGSRVPPKHTTLPRELPFEPIEPRSSSRYGLWWIAIIVVIGLFFSLSYLFERATVTIVPKSLPVAFDTTQTFTAEKDTTDDTAVDFTVMNLSGDESIKLPSTESKQDTEPAKGMVTLYNAYSPSPYKLVKTTRLATPDGRIYRLDTAEVIPGYTISGGVITPGSIDASVTADQPGEASNLDQSNFTLPGLANTPQSAKIYASTDGAITGGISGTVYSISQDSANAALGTLQSKLKDSLIAKAEVQVPDGYIFFDGATVFTPDNNVQVPYSSDPEIPIALHGTLTAYLIKEDTLVAAIAANAVSQYNGEPITIPKLSSLVLAPTGALAPDTDTTFPFTLSGQASIVWTVDPSEVASSLAGKKKSDLQDILSSMPEISRADVVIKPFWKLSFPQDPTKIAVVISQPD